METVVQGFRKLSTLKEFHQESYYFEHSNYKLLLFNFNIISINKLSQNFTFTLSFIHSHSVSLTRAHAHTPQPQHIK